MKTAYFLTPTLQNEQTCSLQLSDSVCNKAWQTVHRTFAREPVGGGDQNQ